MPDLSGKVAIVTGASKGIGASIAKGLAAAGAAVVVNYASSKEGADLVVDAILSEDGRAIAIQGDVSKAEDVKRLFEETKAAFGSLDILVNNAGVYGFDAIETVTESEFYRQFNINVLGSLLTIQEAVKFFGEDGGSVINVSSAASTASLPQTAIYAASKGAVDSITRVLAAELGPRKIRVNTLAPGAVETEGTRATGILDNGFEQQIVAGTPLGRMGQPDDIARVAVFLASEEYGWVTGERLTAAGGYR